MDPTGEAVNQTTPRGYRLDVLPSQELRLSRYVSGVETVQIKTSNIPGAGGVGIASGRIFRIGIRTNENAEKRFNLVALRFEGTAMHNGIWNDYL